MAFKRSPNSLIRCSECGEDYSATYKRCPFCGARNAPPAAPDSKPSPAPEAEPDPRPEPSRPAPPADPDDTYVFDGQDLFDDKGEEDQAPVRSKGGKRLAGKPASNNPFANTDINWPRMITFICSLVIIVAAMVIVFTVVYPQLRDNKPPTADNSESPSLPASASDPGTVPSYPGVAASDPVTAPTDDVPPAGVDVLRGFTTNTFGKDEDGFTLGAGESWQMELTFNPASWSGTVTYSVSDTRYATVSAGGNVVNVNPDGTLHKVILTITAGDITLEMPVFCSGVAATQPPATQPPASDPPATPTPSGSGGVAVGRPGTIVNVGNVGLNVRSGPGRNHSVIGSLYDGTTVNVLEDAGNGWYKISFTGSGGAATQGYIMGDYISIN